MNQPMRLASLRYFGIYQNMKTQNAVMALSALAHETRLKAFRLLIRRGPDGLAAGRIAARLNVVPATLSAHLAQLERAGLVRSWRVERWIYYAVDVDGTRRLLRYLTEDCCRGQPELCGDLLAAGGLCA